MHSKIGLAGLGRVAVTKFLLAYTVTISMKRG